MSAAALAIVLSISIEHPGAGGLCEAVHRRGALVERRQLTACGPNCWSWEPRPDELALCSASPTVQPVLVAAGRDPEVRVDLREGASFTIELASWREGERAIVEGLTRDLTPIALWELTRQTNALFTGDTVRFLRIYRANASPLTIKRQFNDLVEERYSVKLASPGGEVAGIVSRQMFMPKEARFFCGDRVVTAAIGTRGFFSQPELEPGKCTLLARYAGGVERFTDVIEVTQGETTVTREWASEEVGALAISVERSLCEFEEAALILVRARTDGAALTRVEVEPGPRCYQYLEGLVPGTYSVGLYAGDRALAEAIPIDVLASAMAEVELVQFPVRVTGAISVGGEQVGRVMYLEFLQGDERWPIATDESGSYSVALPHGGEFQISVRSTPYLPIATFSGSLHIGEQIVDLELGGGAITLKIVDEDGLPLRKSEPVQVMVQGPGGSKTGFFRGEDEDMAFFGLELGRYTIRAFTISDLVSNDDVQVELTETSPHALREIKLVKSQGVLLVTDDNGEPVGGATIRAGFMILTEERPGSFSLAKVPRGEALMISKAGYSPSCKLRTSSGDVAVILHEGGFSARIQLDKNAAQQSLGRLSQLPGSDCPIPLGLAGASSTTTPTGVLLELSGLSSGRYEYVHPALTKPIQFVVPGDPIEVRSP